MTTSAIAAASLSGRTRLLIGAGLAAAAIGLGAGPLGLAAVASAQYNADWYDWCMNNLEEGSDYCCEHSGGVVRGGACIDPDDLLATVEDTRDVGPSGPLHPVRPEVVAPAVRGTWTLVG
jgi:hypothetical protein